jgi:hypothetical protein
VWSRDDVSGDATYSFTNLYQSGAPQEAVKTTADAAFGALATWLSEQQRLVERAFEARAARAGCALLALPAARLQRPPHGPPSERSRARAPRRWSATR